MPSIKSPKFLSSHGIWKVFNGRYSDSNTCFLDGRTVLGRMKRYDLLRGVISPGWAIKFQKTYCALCLLLADWNVYPQLFWMPLLQHSGTAEREQNQTKREKCQDKAITSLWGGQRAAGLGGYSAGVRSCSGSVFPPHAALHLVWNDGVYPVPWHVGHTHFALWRVLELIDCLDWVSGNTQNLAFKNVRL